MALATLSIDLVAQLASLQSSMDKAGRIAEKNAAQIEARYARMSALAGSVGAALGGAISMAGITQFLRATIDGVDALNDLSDATGASIENLSALEDIAARTGTKMDTVGAAVVKLNKVLLEADPKSPLARALSAIGLSADELRKLDPVVALRDVAVALSKYADDASKARLVQLLFTKSAREMAPLLKDLAENGQLNATVTTEQAKAAERFNQQMSALAKNAADVARNIAGPLVQSLNDFFAVLQKANANPGGFVAGIGEKLNVDFLRARLQATNEALDAGGQQFTSDRNTIADPRAGFYAKSFAAERIREYQDLQAAAEGYRQEIDKILYSSGKRRPANEGGGARPSVGVVPDEIKAPKTDKAKAFISNSFDQATIAALRAMEATDTNKLRELNLALTGLFELQRETRGDPAVAQAIAKVRAEIEALSTKPMPDAEPVRAYVDALAAIQGTKAVEISAVSAALDELFKLRETGLFGPEIEEAINNLRDKLEGLQAPLVDLNSFAAQAGKNIQDALGDTLLANMQGNTASIGRMWGDMLKRMAAQAAAAQLGKLLLGNDFAKTGQAGGWVGDLFKWFGSFGGGRASGGPVQAGRPYLVGERGPEIVVPRNSGTVLPNGTGLAGGNIFNVIVQGDASENTLRLIRGALAQYEARMMMRGA